MVTSTGYVRTHKEAAMAREVDHKMPHDSLTSALLHIRADAWAGTINASPRTQALYQSHLHNHILPYFGDRPIDTITEEMVKEWARELLCTLSPSYVAGIVTVLSRILRHAALDRYIVTNPCDRLRCAITPRHSKTHDRPYYPVPN